MARLVHPFPSILDGLVVAVVALVAGGDTVTGGRLGASMMFLQFAIGAANDVIDARRDVGREGDKPIPGGRVSRRDGIVVAVGAAALGVLLVLPVPELVALALLALAIGLAYDLLAKGTALSWLPFAVGVPLLPVYGWLGATGSLPSLFQVLVPVAAVAGAALAIANAAVDVERDRAAGVGSIAVSLGVRRSAQLVLGLQSLVAGLAVATLAAWRAPTGWILVAAVAALFPLFGAVLGGIAAVRGGRDSRERAWEIQALGTGLLATTWIAAMTAAPAS